ncbi:hypothetical protein [Winogradskyella sp.]|uniref:hypothetical protein n=1 Tax=Winogradskyella sp. TaxID=1883156 RepID=UPI003BAD991C
MVNFCNFYNWCLFFVYSDTSNITAYGAGLIADTSVLTVVGTEAIINRMSLCKSMIKKSN